MAKWASSIPPERFTPTQRKLLAVLADGMPHRREELRQAIGDSEYTFANVQDQLSLARRVLRVRGEDIDCMYNGSMGLCYRHVRILVHVDDPRS